MNKKIVGVTGAKGYLGSALMHQPNMVAIESDICDYEKIRAEIKSKKPDLIVHLAAITDPDFCENPKNELRVKNVNVSATFEIGEICDSLNIGMIFMSTFHVFSGKRWFGDEYSESDRPDPINFYGLSKVTAEAYQVVYPNMKIIRAPYIFDWSRLAERIEVLRNGDAYYPTFLKRSFMHKNHFIESLMEYIERFDEMPSILNISSAETISWYYFMRSVTHALNTKGAALERTKDVNFQTPKPHKAGLNASLSYRMGFEMWSYLDGLDLLYAGM